MRDRLGAERKIVQKIFFKVNKTTTKKEPERERERGRERESGWYY